MRTIPLASIVIASLALAGCGKKDASPTPSAPAGSAASAGAPGTPAVPSVADNKACALMTKDEAAKFIGHPVQDAESRLGVTSVPSCRYKLDGGAGSVSIQFHEHGTTFDSVKGIMVKEPTDIAGAGDKAVRNPDGSLLLVQAHGHMGVVIAMAFGKDAGPTAAAAEAFAPVLAGRL
jgi:hypothetical protein